jgi:hypothetical protein
MPARLAGKMSASREPSLDADVLLSKETAELVRAYYAIGDLEVRRRTLDFLRTVSESICLERPVPAETDPSGEAGGDSGGDSGGDGKDSEEASEEAGAGAEA